MGDPTGPNGLRDFQTWMQTFIVAPGTPEQALSAAESASGLPEGSAQRLVKPSPTLDEMERLMIYRRMYPLRMEEALSIDFPVCRKLLGGRAFRSLVDDYVQAHPSRSWTLDHLGQHLVGFVKEHPLARQYPGLYDLTRLEQSLCEVFNALDSPILTPQDMARVEPQCWPDVALQLIPALRLLHLGSNANDLYKAYNSDRPLPDYQSGASFVVAWRHRFQTWRLSLEEPAFATLRSLADGALLGEALGATLDRYPLDEASVFEWFNTWVGEGFFQAFHPPQPGAAMPTPANLRPI